MRLPNIDYTCAIVQPFRTILMTQENRCFMVRMKQINTEEHERKYLSKKEVVGVGWPDLSGLSHEEIQKKFGRYPVHFRSISEGDIILVPRGSCVLLAKATGEFIADNEPEASELWVRNQQKVKFLREDGKIKYILRADLSLRLQRRLKVPRTVLNITDSDLKEEVSKLWEGKPLKARNYETDREREADFKEQLLKRLRGEEGGLQLKAGGVGLEDLVKKLLELEGYKIEGTSKRTFPGTADADVVGTRESVLGPQEVFVQVKHHQGYTGNWGLKQLEQIKESEEYKERDISWVLLSTADFSPEVEEEAGKLQITLIDGKYFVEALFDRIPTLDPELRRKLGISSVPVFLQGN